MIRKVVLSTALVTTIAGGIRLSGSDDGIGLAARFAAPGLLALDGAGNLFIPDSGNHTIRKLVLATGAVTTVAGLANMSGSADGIGTAARFRYPGAAFFDGAGNLFISEVQNHTVRKLSLATGEVTTLCGSPRMSGSADGIGNLARFFEPRGVALDGRGNLFIADSENDTLRKLDLSSGMVTTPLGATPKTGVVDGTGAAARFFLPRAAVADGAGNLYVADTQNYTIRKVVLSSGEVSTVAGNPIASGSNDGSGPVARFSEIRGLALDGTGHLYVADTGNNTIRNVELATGQVTTLAGHPASPGSVDGSRDAARFDGPRGLAFDGAGNLYVADTNNHTIRKIAVATATVTTLAGRPTLFGTDDGVGDAARFADPSGLAFDGAGNLYLTDLIFNTIRKIELASATVKTLAGQTSREIGSDDGVGAAASFNQPEGLTVDKAGNVYIADTGNSLVRRLEPTSGLVTTIAGIRGRFGVKLGWPAGLNHPPAVVALPSGALVILDESAVLLAR
jgi:sugar lactone lactonase YvrE